MDAAQLLQTLGLTKYEAEAYTALLREGSLTGYELGKRSAVPLPRIYDVLKRLVDRGLVLSRPGDPPRYKAADPALFLDQVRSTMAETLDRVTELLAELPRDDRPDDFWVVETRSGILAHATSLMREQRRSIELLVRARPAADIDALIALAHGKCDETPAITHELHGGPEQLALVIDGHQALLGTITPSDRCQAILSTHPALVAAVRAYAQRERGNTSALQASHSTSPGVEGEWLAWEEEKQRRLLQLGRNAA